MRSWSACSPDLADIGCSGAHFDDALPGDGLPELQSLLEAEHDGGGGFERAGNGASAGEHGGDEAGDAGDDGWQRPRVCLHATRSGVLRNTIELRADG